VSAVDIYGGIDPSEAGAYSLAEVANYLGIAPSTLRSWCHGQPYRTKSGAERFFKPLLRIYEQQGGMLSYSNFVEAHVLRALRRQVTLPKVREILHGILAERPDSRHPLIEYEFATVGKDVFVERAGALINVARNGQVAFREALEGYLRRIKRNPQGTPTDLYPFPGGKPLLEWPQSVQMNPRVAFGRPVIAGTNIPISVISSRVMAGDDLDLLAEDYDLDSSVIFEAVRWEVARAA
jgi:uncharacterized protein (DUF433 family)